jgi:RNA polymerase sigma-70 factor (ECF subfamily)
LCKRRLQASYLTKALPPVSKEKYDHITDQELLDRFYHDRNNEWLGILLSRYTLLLFGVCMKYLKNEEEARDGVQQVFLKVITELHKYKVDYFKSWIYMIAKNLCLMKLREKQGKIPVNMEEDFFVEDPALQQLNNHVEKDRILELMNRALHELSEDQKRCVTLFYLEKVSYQEIASRTGFSLMQVKSNIQNGKRNLRNYLAERIKKHQVDK